MAKKTKKRTRQSDQLWIIKKDDFRNVLDILERAISEPFIPPKRPAKDPLKTKRQRNKKRNSE
jgi:hypothetical protein